MISFSKLLSLVHSAFVAGEVDTCPLVALKGWLGDECWICSHVDKCWLTCGKRSLYATSKHSAVPFLLFSEILCLRVDPVE